MASVWKPAKACHDFNNGFTLFTAVPVLFIMYTNKDSNLISAQRSSSGSHSTPWKPKDRRHKLVTIDDPPSEYYGSDEQDSDSEDDLN